MQKSNRKKQKFLCEFIFRYFIINRENEKKFYCQVCLHIRGICYSDRNMNAGYTFTFIKSNQITFIVTSPQHKCLAVSEILMSVLQTAQKNNNSNLHMDSTYLQTVQKTMCKIHIHILST